jgi:rSAM/selenodomain-associated transferase 1
MARPPFADGTSVKTRLAAVIPDENMRRRLYAAFLRDVLATCRELTDAAVRIAHTPDGGIEGFGGLCLAAGDLMPQRGDDLGARERHLFEDLFAEGFDRVLVMGSDLPTLPAAHLERARMLLDSNDSVVLGPAEDGGYYLMGLAAGGRARPVPDLFTEIRWSSPFALEDTLRAAERARLRVQLAPTWYDVDDEAGFERLRADLARDASVAPATQSALHEIFGEPFTLPASPPSPCAS